MNFELLEVNRPPAERESAGHGGGLGLLVEAELEPLAPAQQALHARDENRQLEGLGQIVVGARLKSPQHVLGTAAGGEHQHRHELPGAPQLGRHVEPVDAWQHHIEDDEVEPVGLEQRERPFSRVHHLNVVMFGDEVKPQALGEVLLVFDNEEAAHGGGISGNCTVNVLPRPEPSLSANTLPPWRAITDRTMNRPRPVPFTRIATAPGTR